jgi:hypothetical protein
MAAATRLCLPCSNEPTATLRFFREAKKRRKKQEGRGGMSKRGEEQRAKGEKGRKARGEGQAGRGARRERKARGGRAGEPEAPINIPVTLQTVEPAPEYKRDDNRRMETG